MKFFILLILCMSTSFAVANSAIEPVDKGTNLHGEDLVAFHDAAMDILSSSQCRVLFRKYMTKAGPKAFAYTVDPRGYYGQCTNDWQAKLKDAEKYALQKCNNDREKSRYTKKFAPECKLFASNNQLLVSMADYGLKPHEVNLDFTAERKSLAAVKKMVEAGADIHQTFKFGGTALTRAAWENRQDIVEYLVSKGADIKHKENMGFDALNIAAQRGNAPLFQYLLDKGADIDTTINKGKKKPIHHAAEYGHVKILQLILKQDKQYDFSQPDEYKITALHYAAENKRFAEVKFLVEKGANVNAKSKTGKTPLDYAIKRKNGKIAAYLDSKGATSNYKKTVKPVN